MKLSTHMPDGERRKILRFVGQRSRSQLLKIEQKCDTFVFRTISQVPETKYTHVSC